MRHHNQPNTLRIWQRQERQGLDGLYAKIEQDLLQNPEKLKLIKYQDAWYLIDRGQASNSSGNESEEYISVFEFDAINNSRVELLRIVRTSSNGFNGSGSEDPESYMRPAVFHIESREAYPGLSKFALEMLVDQYEQVETQQ